MTLLKLWTMFYRPQHGVHFIVCQYKHDDYDKLFSMIGNSKTEDSFFHGHFKKVSYK